MLGPACTSSPSSSNRTCGEYLPADSSASSSNSGSGADRRGLEAKDCILNKAPEVKVSVKGLS
jgi:hypothetical protein